MSRKKTSSTTRQASAEKERPYLRVALHLFRKPHVSRTKQQQEPITPRDTSQKQVQQIEEAVVLLHHTEPFQGDTMADTVTSRGLNTGKEMTNTEKQAETQACIKLLTAQMYTKVSNTIAQVEDHQLR